MGLTGRSCECELERNSKIVQKILENTGYFIRSLRINIMTKINGDSLGKPGGVEKYKDIIERLKEDKDEAVRQMNLQRKEAEQQILILNKELESKKDYETAMGRRLQLEKIISEISREFVLLDLSELDFKIDAALRQVGEFAGVDRSYIFLFDEDKMSCSNSHEWCRKGIEPQIDNLQDIPVEYIPWWMSKLSTFQIIHIPKVSEMPPEANLERESLEAQSIQSLLVIPLLATNELIGFVGFDSVETEKQWEEEDIFLLNILGSIFGNGFGKKHSQEELVKIYKDLGFSLAATATIDQALEQVISYTLKIEGVDCVWIYKHDEDLEELELVAHKGLSEKFISYVGRYSKSSPQYNLVLKGKALYGRYEDILQNNGEFFDNEGYGFMVVLPIRYEERTIGAMNLASRNKKPFGEYEKIFIEAIASQIGGTLTRINAENALKMSQDNFRLMFETIDDFMFILDNNGNIIKTNPVVSRRLGYTEEELKGMNVLEVHPPLRREEAGRIVAEMLSGKLDTCPVPLFCKNGETIPVETKVVTGKWNGEDALYGISRDVTERVEAQRALVESEERLNFALKGTGDGVWDWCLSDGTVFYSEQWKRMIGYSVNEIGNTIGEWESRVHPDDLPLCTAELERHFRRETPVYANEHRIMAKDGNYRWILDRGKVVEWNENGSPRRVIGMHTDITQRRELEDHLRRTLEKEKELNELKSRFVSTASHEFRTPLASILLISEILITYYEKLDKESIWEKLYRIKYNIQHLTNIVNDVLQLSKIQEGKIGFNPSKTNVCHFCRNIVDEFNRSFMPEGGAEFYSEKETLTAMVDTNLLNRSLNNLLSNALKYSPVDTKIIVRLENLGKEWSIAVKDNGIGIPESDQKHLFSPFFRAGNVSNIQGNGLGLSIVNESVQMHKGRVSFESKVAEGTTFTLFFPRDTIVADIDNL